MSDHIDHPQHQLALEQGRDDGRRAGRMAGFDEGRTLGQTKGVEYGMEVGFALGLVEAGQQWHQPQQQQQLGSSTSTTTTSGIRIPAIVASSKKDDSEGMNNMHSSGIIHFNDRIQRSIDELARAIRNFPIKAEDILALHRYPTNGPSFDAEGRDGLEEGIVDGDGDKLGHDAFTMTELSSVSHVPNKMDLQDQLQQIRGRSKVLLAKLGLPHHSLPQIMQQTHLPQDKVSSTSSSSYPTTLDNQTDESGETKLPKTTIHPASATMNEW